MNIKTIDDCILREENGKKVYSHQKMVILYIAIENHTLEEAIEAVDFEMSNYKIEVEEPNAELSEQIIKTLNGVKNVNKRQDVKRTSRRMD